MKQTTLYNVYVVVNYTTDEGWEGSRTLPTFVIDPNIQGASSPREAANIVMDILRWMRLPGERDIFASITVTDRAFMQADYSVDNLRIV